jgi:hypothetical protein
VAKLIAPGDALCNPLLPELYEPVLTNIGQGVLVLRGFEREGEASTVQGGGASYSDSSVAQASVSRMTGSDPKRKVRTRR